MKLNKNSIILVIITSVASCSATYFADKISDQHNQQSIEKNNSQIPSSANSCDFNAFRLSGYRYIKPLVYAEPQCESPEFADLKSQVTACIQKYAGTGNIMTASVYIREFDHGNWTVINPEERYHPGSLMKVPLMITFLKLEEKKAGWLDKKILINKIENSVPSQTFTSKAIEKGKIYTVRQLLEYMIAYSDNNATWALHQFVDMEEYRNTYRYLNVTVPDFQDPNYTLSPKEFSTLMKVLYNSSYLSNDHSEFAVEMLMKSDFQLGFRKGFPEGTTIAGKFGEWGNDSAGIHELHESGFIYLDGKAYLVTVMTRGSEVQKLPGFIASVSKVIYENLEKGASLS